MPQLVIRTSYMNATIGGPQLNVTVGSTEEVVEPVSAPSPGMPENGLIHRSSWSQRILVVRPSKIRLFSLMIGGCTFFTIAPVPPDGFGEALVIEARLLMLALRLKSIWSGLK